MTEQIEDDFWAQERARDTAARGKQADPTACGTCRTAVEAGGQVKHDECAQRAVLLPAPDAPGYELITGMTEAEVRALPARFHTPVFMESSSPSLWVCAVCWGEGWVAQWPCATAVRHGLRVFTPEHEAETAARRQEAELDAFRALALGDLDGRTSGACTDPTHPMWIRRITDARGCAWCRVVEVSAERDAALARVAELEAQRERRRIRLVAAETDLLNMRGLLSPNGHPRRIPDEVEIHERVAPAVEWLLNRVTELETERAKYVGVEPTIAEEMAYISNSLDAVIGLCHEQELAARAFELPVPEWIVKVREAADGLVEAPANRPALPWARLMDDHDLSMFLDDLVSAALNRWRTDVDGPVPDRETLAAIEQACQDWRTPGQGLRGDEPGAESREPR